MKRKLRGRLGHGSHSAAVTKLRRALTTASTGETIGKVLLAASKNTETKALTRVEISAGRTAIRPVVLTKGRHAILGRIKTRIRPVNNQTQPVQWVQNAQYNVANQLLSASYSPGYTETRHYNTLLQMDEQKFTRPTSGGNPAMDLHYSFSPNANNGKILGVTESVTGETINYAYDTLNRLISASGAGNPGLGTWGETFTFDGFGNLTDKNATGNATSWHSLVDYTTNRLQSGNQYDPQTGNLTGTGNMQMTYDVANRVSTVLVSSAPAGMYGYDQDNHRVWTLTPAGGEQVHFFGAFGERLATYKPAKAAPT
jgi:hypothetical protein